jgi:phage terminase large subunit-like protein
MIDYQKYRHNIIAFAEDLYYIEPGKPIRLWDYQKEMLIEAMQREPDGNYIYDTVIYSLPRQNSKSELSAIISCHALFCGGYNTDVLTVAVGGIENAKIIFGKAKRAIRHSPELFSLIGDKNFLKSEISVPGTDSTWTISQSKNLAGSGILGRGYSLVGIDELGHDEYGNMGEIYDALSAGQAATPNARICVTSTVGSQKHGKLFDLFEQSKTDENMLLIYRNDNPSPLITERFLNRQRKRLHPSIYSWWHENLWNVGDSQFITRELWDRATQREWLPVGKLEKPHRSIQFIDIGLVHDATVVATVFKMDDEVRLAELRSWQGSKQNPVQLSDIENYLIDSHERFRVYSICLDSWQGAQLAERAKARHFKAELIHIRNLPDMQKMEEEAMNLVIEPKGASFKVNDPGKVHQDRIFALAGACHMLNQLKPKRKWEVAA